jgi:hypothetical protein
MYFIIECLSLLLMLDRFTVINFGHLTTNNFLFPILVILRKTNVLLVSRKSMNTKVSYSEFELSKIAIRIIYLLP